MAIHSPEFIQKKRRRARVVAFVALCILGTLFGASIYLANMNRFLISEVEVEGNEATTDREIERVVWEKLEGKYIWLYDKSNGLIYPRGDIRQELYSRIPRILDADFELEDSRTLVLSVRERVPHSIYCQEVLSLTDPSGCFFIDETGFIFSQAPFFSGEVYFIFYSDEPPEDPLGERFLPESDFLKLSSLIDGLEKLGVELVAFGDLGTKDEYHLILKNGARIMWKSSESFESVAKNLESFLLDESIAGDGEFLDRVEYIDLRFENKVFYKFQD